VTQLAIGFLLGILVGLAIRQLRPLVLLLLACAAAGCGYVVYQAGLPGLARLLEHFAGETRIYSAFFAALAIGKLVGGALAHGR
jgi:cyanate permease